VVGAALLALQQVEGEAAGHGLVALAAHAGAGGNGGFQGQAEVFEGEGKGGGLAAQLAVGVVGAVVAAGCEGQVLAACLGGAVHELDVQVAAGVQGHGRGAGWQAQVVGHDVLQPVVGGQGVVGAELGAAGDQCGVVFQAGEMLAIAQQAAAEVAFAGAPVQPVAGGIGEGQGSGEGFDLLPFAAGHVDVEPVASDGHVSGRQRACCAERMCLPGQRRKRRGGVQVEQRVMHSLGLGQGAGAQPAGKLGIFGFPR